MVVLELGEWQAVEPIFASTLAGWRGVSIDIHQSVTSL